MKKYDVISFGEALIDFTSIGKSKNGMNIFEQNPGGAPANVAVACAKLGLSTAFIGKVGSDMHGSFIIETLKSTGVDTSLMLRDKKAFTTLAFVDIDEKGDRSFSFSRYKSADVMLSPLEINLEALKNTKVFHFGSLSLTDEPVRSSTYAAIDEAKKNGAVISYDPNYRPLLWESEETAKKEMRAPLPLVDIIKISDEETELICDTADISEAAKILHRIGINIVIITCGSKGAYISCNNSCVELSSEKAKVVDTTGAGDSFLGGFLYRYVKEGLPKVLTESQLCEFGTFAGKVAAYCIERRGAIPAMPSLTDISIK